MYIIPWNQFHKSFSMPLFDCHYLRVQHKGHFVAKISVVTEALIDILLKNVTKHRC